MAGKRLIKNIAFFGSAEVKSSNQFYQEALIAAQSLAKKGYTIVNGGGGGIMNASTQGAVLSGGETLAITFNPHEAPGFEGRYLINQVDKEIETSNYVERMFKLMEHADCFIIFKGGTGTISEFGTAWALAKLYYPHHKPFILYGKFWHKIIEVFRQKMLIPKKALTVFKIVENQEEMIKAIINLEEEMANYDHSHCRICADKAFMT